MKVLSENNWKQQVICVIFIYFTSTFYFTIIKIHIIYVKQFSQMKLIELQ